MCNAKSAGRKNVFKVKVGGVDSTQPVATLVVPTNSTEEPADQPRRKRRRLDGPPAAGVRGEVQNSPSQVGLLPSVKLHSTHANSLQL